MNIELTDGVVTLLVRHRIKQGQEQAYETWLRQIIAKARSYPGHLGIDVVRGHSGGLGLFTSVLRFASTEQLQNWLDSADRRELVEQAQHLLADGDQTEINADREFWFTPQDSAAPTPPPRWKQACVTFLVILPLSFLVPQLWKPVFALLPWLGGYVPATVLITLSIVLLVVYVFMPRVTRLFRRWLQPRSAA
ncbi:MULTISPECIES: antibiotic biosynthesis monooxygenase [Pseudomonas]|uniref:Antibiotic biosynthesis monooxygenase n=1 Tax=Pseudomonas protegens TaxID=380021 RepID=A0A2T6GRF8_9PSED|nr:MULTISPECIES: antibiotic biosynthesis monooxygenase [Pseudomonas]PUA46726.1 antibiotic biosynthesis monooxygenase [Pseudomonas protegens]RXU67676.1 antibiotic biosynthesis monooxygenase [Pseudomonas protegens]ULT68397.1 antibiotic biosynthesis monooxygenase [Pseudomonas sp. BC42]BAQ74170.1 antibiotic biosynthesis monooxygenase domain-containing protein [Pseudomonas sp. Os17]BAQ80465.1 antibiotic biosynthesis monooxygenase domain-containing protein [Pseudomonas sp. St29]